MRRKVLGIFKRRQSVTQNTHFEYLIDKSGSAGFFENRHVDLL
jgi:hypothetical protein